jgi:hypothetical protein
MNMIMQLLLPTVEIVKNVSMYLFLCPYSHHHMFASIKRNQVVSVPYCA